MNQFYQAVSSDALHIGIAAVVAILSLFFLGFVLIRGVRLVWSLRRVLGRVRAVDRSYPAQMKTNLAGIFDSRQLRPLWVEYQDTLHEQNEIRGIESSVQAVRATVPAESFFNAELVVDDHLHTEFFKHLPGILTGLGIIATFSGLISGLQAFDVTAVDPDALKLSLGSLFGHVGNAFMLSAVAIGLAMLFTILEKLVYAANLHAVSAIAAELDGMFRAGVGEEYLSQLVRSSEEGTTQTRQLKESLVEDLKALLTNLTEQQIQATRQLSNDIGTNLEASLQAPLQKIAETVQLASRDQSDSAGRMIENLMAAFMTQMRDSMGGQMGELSAMMRQSAESMSLVENSLRTLVSDMQRASQSSSEGIQSAMTELMHSLASHERQQSEAIGNAQVQMLAQIQAAIEKMAASQEISTARVNDAASDASTRMAAAAAQAQQASDVAAGRAEALAARVGEQTLEAIGQMESGASKIAAMISALDGASVRLEGSGTALAEVQRQANGLAAQVQAAAEHLRRSADAAAASTNALATVSLQMEGVSTSMAAEAQARESSLSEVQTAMRSSREAAEQFREFSGQVTEELGHALAKFGDGTVAVLDRSLVSFDKELSNAVESLRGVMERLTVLAADRS